MLDDIGIIKGCFYIKNLMCFLVSHIYFFLGGGKVFLSKMDGTWPDWLTGSAPAPASSKFFIIINFHFSLIMCGGIKLSLWKNANKCVLKIS